MYAAADKATALAVSAVLLMLSGILMVPAVGPCPSREGPRGGPGGVGGRAWRPRRLWTFRDRDVLSGRAGPSRGDPEQMVAYVDRLNALPALSAIAFPLIFVLRLRGGRHGVGGLADRAPRMVGPRSGHRGCTDARPAPDQLNRGRTQWSGRDRRGIRLPRDSDRSDEPTPPGTAQRPPGGCLCQPPPEARSARSGFVRTRTFRAGVDPSPC